MTSTSYASTDSANPKTVISLAITPSATNSKILVLDLYQLGCYTVAIVGFFIT